MAQGRQTKRKRNSSSLDASKKVKTKHLEDLPWKTISRPQGAGVDDFDGIMELEEVDNVEVVYEESKGGKILKFNVFEDGEEGPSNEAGPSNLATDSTSSQDDTPEPVLAFDTKTLLPEWHSYRLHPHLLRALYSRHFTSPTPIQARALPAATKGKDVVGVAETGSGKTLAYGLPILHRLMGDASQKPKSQLKKKRSLCALILAPTRELALQVSSHLNECLQSVDLVDPNVKREEEGADTLFLTDAQGSKKGKQKVKPGEKPKTTQSYNKPKSPPLVSIAAIVGGMSAQKQRRILDRGVDIMVATPGRLWDILQEDDDLANQIKCLRYLVLDEADRMIETGHFAELDNILRLTLRQEPSDAIEPHTEIEEGENITEQNPTVSSEESPLQTFVFSATLSKDLQRNLKKRSKPKHGKNKKPASTLDDLLMRLDFRDPEPEIIDLSPEGGVVSTLKESKVDILAKDKDAYLYYFLLRYPGRSLVFLSSIDGIRRLMPLMELLELKAFPLHSQLEQRQRLKNLDRFKSTPNSVLLATDIASRGLDIPAVDHVVHYQIPRSADVYVHRNGRTARAMNKGFSLLMVAPDERRLVRALLHSLGRQEEEIPEMSIELYLLDKLKARIQVARRIDSAQHKIKKENHEKNWLREAAEAMEIELDSDLAERYSSDEATTVPSKHERKATNAKTAGLKAELKQLLAQPLVAKGVSTRYITSGSRSIAEDVIAGEYHETMLGLKKTEAGHDVVALKPKRAKQKQKEVEEWTGFGS